MRNKKALTTILAMVALSLLLAGPVLAQEGAPSVSNGPPGPPGGLYGLTTEDNTGNGGTGPPDGDMDPWVFNTDENHPIEFYISEGAAVQPAANGGLFLYLGVCDVDYPDEVDEVHVNGQCVGFLPDSFDQLDGSCEIVTAPIPGGLLTGHDLVEVFVDQKNPGEGDWSVWIDWGGIGPSGLAPEADEMWPCPEEEEFVPEPGSIVLLASGLMGMAGYAGLRLRKK